MAVFYPCCGLVHSLSVALGAVVFSSFNACLGIAEAGLNLKSRGTHEPGCLKRKEELN